MENEIIQENDYRATHLMSPEIDKIAQALVEVQKSLKTVIKAQEGHGYKYSDLSSCLEALQKPLTDNGLCVTNLISNENGNPALITFLIHISGQWFKSISPIISGSIGNKNAIQQFGAAITYCRRYALSALTGLSQADDDAKICRDGQTTITRKEEAKNEAIDTAMKLIDLCKSSDIDAKKFADFHKITKSNPEGVQYAINNFEILKADFQSSLTNDQY